MIIQVIIQEVQEGIERKLPSNLDKRLMPGKKCEISKILFLLTSPFFAPSLSPNSPNPVPPLLRVVLNLHSAPCPTSSL